MAGDTKATRLTWYNILAKNLISKGSVESTQSY